jgi:predicted CoA-binding protein
VQQHNGESGVGGRPKEIGEQERVRTVQSQFVTPATSITVSSLGVTIYGDDATIRNILTSTGDVWAVVGLSDNPERAAYRVAEKLQRLLGKKVVPVHPKAETVHGEQGYASLEEIPFPVDVVDVFVNSDLAGDIADQAVALGAKAVWFQVGVIDEAAYERTRAAGLQMVMDCSPGREIPRLGLG